MNKILLTALVLLITISSVAQSETESNIDTVFQNNENKDATYRLFPTKNMWTFIKLNTRNGQMSQVQYSMEDNRQETVLNAIKLVEESNERSNRFTLYPTQNTWTFILLDQDDGRTWQVQWSIEEEDRGVFSIEKLD